MVNAVLRTSTCLNSRPCFYPQCVAYVQRRTPITLAAKASRPKPLCREHGKAASLCRPSLRCSSALNEQPVDDGEFFAVKLAKIADETKCADVVVLHVAPLVSWTSYMLFCTVMSRPQLLAVLTRMEKEAEANYGRTKRNQAGTSSWELLDFGDVVVHVFTPEQRDYYDVEGFYAAAEEIELPFKPEYLQEDDGSRNKLDSPSWTIS